jgi:serine/threonine-protein kinase
VTVPVGTLLSDRYRLDAKIGSGGMSTVFRAFDTVLEREVAIKVLHTDIAHDADQLERFRREARAVAQLNHPHIVGIIDAADDERGPYIVFEYVSGQTLKERIRECGKLEIGEAVAYAIEIARALGVAHERGIVHRDVKPQNVLIDEEGAAKVTDFGIARTLDQAGLTADGRVLGTTDYVSPEQALGRPVTGQSDLYSLGIVLYEMLTGEVPFKGENQVAVAMKHVREDLPDVQRRRPEVSSALASVVDRSTAKDLGVRYPDDQSLIADLEDVLAIETARSGEAGNQATAVLRTLSPKARRRVPSRVLHPARIFVALGLVIVATVVALVLLAGNAKRGTNNAVGHTPRDQPGIKAVTLGAHAAEDYDPDGTGGEHHELVTNVLDGNPSTSWRTETYNGGTLNGKPGVGIYVDAKPSAVGARLEIDTPTPGWSGTIYGAADGSGPPAKIDDPGWVPIGDIGSATRHYVARLPGKRYRYYLVWIQKLPEGKSSVSISEIRLYQKR